MYLPAHVSGKQIPRPHLSDPNPWRVVNWSLWWPCLKNWRDISSYGLIIIDVKWNIKTILIVLSYERFVNLRTDRNHLLIIYERKFRFSNFWTKNKRLMNFCLVTRWPLVVTYFSPILRLEPRNKFCQLIWLNFFVTYV